MPAGAALTHPDPRSLGGCLRLAAALVALLAGAGPAAAWQEALAALGFLAWQWGLGFDEAWQELAARRPRVRRLPGQVAAVAGWLRSRRGGARPGD